MEGCLECAEWSRARQLGPVSQEGAHCLTTHALNVFWNAATRRLAASGSS